MQIDGRPHEVPYTNRDVSIFYSGIYIQLVAKKCGLKVAFDGNNVGAVAVDDRYHGQVIGLCGNCDGRRNDLR